MMFKRGHCPLLFLFPLPFNGREGGQGDRLQLSKELFIFGGRESGGTHRHSGI